MEAQGGRGVILTHPLVVSPDQSCINIRHVGDIRCLDFILISGHSNVRLNFNIRSRISKSETDTPRLNKQY
jgi:hypothetical protein